MIALSLSIMNPTRGVHSAQRRFVGTPAIHGVDLPLEEVQAAVYRLYSELVLHRPRARSRPNVLPERAVAHVRRRALERVHVQMLQARRAVSYCRRSYVGHHYRMGSCGSAATDEGMKPTAPTECRKYEHSYMQPCCCQASGRTTLIVASWSHTMRLTHMK